MAQTREQKQKIIKTVENCLKGAQSAVLVSFDGLKISDTDKLRSECHDKHVEYMVVKKNLLQIALKNAGNDINLDDIHSSVGIGVSASDDLDPAKIFYQFGKTREKVFGLNHYFLRGKDGAFALLQGYGVKELAEIPSKKDLYQKVCVTLQSPLYKFVYIANYNLRRLLMVLEARRASQLESS